MKSPIELKENTAIDQKHYPVKLFRNIRSNVKLDDGILHLHWHEHIELIKMVKGKAIFFIDSIPYSTEKGEVLLIPSGALHVGYAASEGTIEYDSIVFNASLLHDWMYDVNHTKQIRPLLQNEYLLPIKISSHEQENTVITSLVDSICEELLHRNYMHQSIVKGSLHILYAQLARKYQQQNKPELQVNFAHRDSFKNLIDHVAATTDQKITIEQAAQIVNLNPFHFCKLFKKLTGRTFIDYVNYIKISKAELLLRDTSASMNEIALQIGISNQNYFTKLFKHYHALTPSEYRQQTQNPS